MNYTIVQRHTDTRHELNLIPVAQIIAAVAVLIHRLDDVEPTIVIGIEGQRLANCTSAKAFLFLVASLAAFLSSFCAQVVPPPLSHGVLVCLHDGESLLHPAVAPLLLVRQNYWL
jgi:hypothetical protein